MDQREVTNSESPVMIGAQNISVQTTTRIVNAAPSANDSAVIVPLSTASNQAYTGHLDHAFGMMTLTGEVDE